MLRIVRETVMAVTPHVLGVEAVDGLPSADPRASVDFLEDWLDKGIPEFRVISTAAFLALSLYSIIKRGHTFPRLDHSRQAELLERLYRAKGMLAYQFLYFLATPAVNAYYSRVDVQKVLGFDIPALKQEAEMRLVTRDGGPLQPREAPSTPGSNGGESER
jgi:hypothetical protein